jgi:tetratricopeptide (TPR) repeat protein
MRLEHLRWVFFLLSFGLLLALCVPFFGNPLFFDDQYFFLAGAPEKFLVDGVHLSTRWWVYQTLAATFVFFDADIRWLRLGNLLAHMITAVVLYSLVRRLLLDLDKKANLGLSADVAAFLVAALFAVHPLAIFSQGYLIQRTIVCASLFSLLSLLAFWRGLGGSRFSLWASCLLFGTAVAAKEHAVMLPIASLLFLVLYQRSGLKSAVTRVDIFAALCLQALLALLVVLQLKGILGAPYEMLTAEVLEGEASIPRDTLYPLSVLNQAGLFFKYMFMWGAPNSTWMSIDIREAFPLHFSSWALWGGFILFVAYVGSCIALLLRGGALGLLGLSLLLPGVLFFTEFSAVRLQEPFVLYRSYLWAPFLFVALALGVRRLSKTLIYILGPVIALYLTALSFDRLTTLSHPYLIWNEAAELLERSAETSNVFGGYRIYYNRGNALYRDGMLEPALADYDRTLQLKPNYGHAYQQRGVIYLDQKQWVNARVEFEKAIVLLPNNIKSYLGRVQALEALGQVNEANKTLQMACALGSHMACERHRTGESPDG